MTTTQPTSTTPELLVAQYHEMTRQESRVDKKGDQLVTLTRVLTSLSLFASTKQPWHIAILLLMTTLLWTSAVIILLWCVVRPRVRASDDLAGRRIPDLTNWYADKINLLSRIVFLRYCHIGRATNLIIAGFIPAVLAGCIVFVIGG
jgi:hypothetical protein